MECITEAVFEVESLYARFLEMKDTRKARGMRYALVTILVMMVIAKLCGEDTPSGIADWVKHRSEQFIEMLKLKRKTMPHHSTYRRISEDVIDIEELEGVVSTVLSGRKYYGKQVLLSIDGKVLRGTLDETQKGTYLLAAYLPTEGVVLMEIAIEGKGSEIPGAAKLLKMVDLREKVVMGDALHTQRAVSIQIVEAGGSTSGWPKATSLIWKRIFACGLNQNQTLSRVWDACQKTSRLPKKSVKDMAGSKNAY